MEGIVITTSADDDYRVKIDKHLEFFFNPEHSLNTARGYARNNLIELFESEAKPPAQVWYILSVLREWESFHRHELNPDVPLGQKEDPVTRASRQVDIEHRLRRAYQEFAGIDPHEYYSSVPGYVKEDADG